MKKPLTPFAKKLRNNSTDAENHLWYMLRNKQFGVKFRRQAMIGHYIVDFVSYARKLVIEVDGGQHAESEKDKVRDRWLKKEGFRILRFWDHDVLKNRDGVWEKLTEHLAPPPIPSPRRGRGKGLKVLFDA